MWKPCMSLKVKTSALFHNVHVILEKYKCHWGGVIESQRMCVIPKDYIS